MKTAKRSSHALHAALLAVLCAGLALPCASLRARADDEPAITEVPEDGAAVDLGGSPAAAPAAGGDEAAVDLGAGASEDYFNPYVFSRNPLWLYVPALTLLFLGLHLLPVPKRGAQKLRSAESFFKTGILRKPKDDLRKKPKETA